MIGRLEKAVSRLEALNAGQHPSTTPRGLIDNTLARDPAILAFDELVVGALGRVSAAAGKIGADVAEVIGLVEKAFLIAKDLLVRTKQTEVCINLFLFFSFFLSFEESLLVHFIFSVAKLRPNVNKFSQSFSCFLD